MLQKRRPVLVFSLRMFQFFGMLLALGVVFFFSLNHSSCSSGKDFEFSSSSNASALTGVLGFGGICIGFSGMCGSIERFRRRMKLDIADRDIVIPFSAKFLRICLCVA